MLVLTTSGKDGYCAVRNKQKSVSINNPVFYLVLSYTVSPVLSQIAQLCIYISKCPCPCYCLVVSVKDLQDFL